MESKLIKDYFSRSMITIDVSASIKDAIDFIMLTKVRHLPVVNPENVVVGMISDRDILPLMRVLGDEAEMLKKTGVKSIMTRDVQVISADDSLETAAQMMIEGYFHALPVVEDQKLVGIITSTDLLRMLVEEDYPVSNPQQNFSAVNSTDQDET